MRWILVFIFLYVIPLIILFRNYKNLKRSCIYGSIYVVLVTTIAISNVYMSGLSKIEESLYYENYAFDQRYKDKYESNFDNNMKNNTSREENKEKENKEDFRSGIVGVNNRAVIWSRLACPSSTSWPSHEVDRHISSISLSNDGR